MPTYQRVNIHSSDDLRAVVDATGSCRLSPNTLRFFDSRLLSGVFPAISNTGPTIYAAASGNVFYFVTSERYAPEPRHYRVRKLTLGTQRDDRPAVSFDSGSDTYGTAGAARTVAQTFASGVAEFVS